MLFRRGFGYSDIFFQLLYIFQTAPPNELLTMTESTTALMAA